MKLLTKTVVRQLPPLYSQEAVKDPQVVVKFFNPCGAATWWATEGSYVDDNGNMIEEGQTVPEGANFLFFGFVTLGDPNGAELGYFSLQEIEAVQLPFGLGIERDIHWSPQPLSKVQATVQGGA